MLCGHSAELARRNRLYCSHSCQQRAYRKRKKQQFETAERERKSLANLVEMLRRGR
jgi:hypothetical protein